MPSKLVPEVLFSCDGCCFDVFAVSDDDAVVMVMVASTSHCAMGPQSTILSINHYSRPY